MAKANKAAGNRKGLTVHEAHRLIQGTFRPEVNHRLRVLLELDGKRYVSTVSLGRLRRTSFNHPSTQQYVCEVARLNRHKHVTEKVRGVSRERLVMTGTELATWCRGYSKGSHCGDVYAVVGLVQEDGRLIVQLGQQIQKAKSPVLFNLKEYVPQPAAQKPKLQLVG